MKKMKMKLIEDGAYGHQVARLIERLKTQGTPATVRQLREYAGANPPAKNATIYALGELVITDDGIMGTPDGAKPRMLKNRRVSGRLAAYYPDGEIREKTITDDWAGYGWGTMFLIVSVR